MLHGAAQTLAPPGPQPVFTAQHLGAPFLLFPFRLPVCPAERDGKGPAVSEAHTREAITARRLLAPGRLVLAGGPW